MSKTQKQIPRQPLELPPCGLFFGSGIYHGQAGYLARSGRMHTAWVPQSHSPIELLDKIIEDNQGNLAQFWGLKGGWGFNGERCPVTLARFHALEDVGIEAPQPDWKQRQFLCTKDWSVPEEHAGRHGAGVLKFIQEAAKRGIYSILIYTDAKPEWAEKFQSVGPHYLGYDFGERFSFRLDEEHVVKNGGITLKTLSENLLKRVRDHVQERKAQGWGAVMATSANFYIDYEIAAGADVPLMEDFAFSHINMASAICRGLYRQFDLPVWGSHMAHEHYSWTPFDHEHKFELLTAAFRQKYMAGAKIILNESGNWFLQTVKAVDSPLFEMPRVELGGITKCDPHLVAPHVEEAQKTYHKIDYHSTYPKRYRETISDFYDFVKTHGTPEGQPEVTVAVAKGNHDLCGHEFAQNAVVAGMYSMAEKNPCWYEGQPERGWNIVKNVFFPRPPVLAPFHNRFLSGTPLGMVDIVSFAEDRIDADFLSAHYKALLFSGWNTSSPAQYHELKKFVAAGGTLFIAIPHLSMDETRNHSSYTVEDLVNGGDFADLCGVKVRKKGRRFYWATAPDRKDKIGFTFPRRFGIFTTCMGEIEITDPAAEILAVDDEEMEPLLLRHRLGKGTVYFLNSWSYPGALDSDEGPGSHIGSTGLIGTIYRHIARENRGTVWIDPIDEASEHELDYISYSYFPKSKTICLQNIDFKKPHRCTLHEPGRSTAMELAPAEFRLVQAGGQTKVAVS